MAIFIRPGFRKRSMSRDKDGHRTYKVTLDLESDNPIADGPATILGLPGIPQIGDYYNWGGDVDMSALLTPEVRFTDELDSESSCLMHLELTYSTRPLDRCQTNPVGNPLLDPPQISGSFVSYTQEMTHDRFGRRFKSSSHEQLRGAQVEFDAGRADVQIRHNMANLELPLISSLYQHVNAGPMWGMPPRTIKFSGFGFTRRVMDNCTYFYERSYVFDVRQEGFDRLVVDQGTKVLRGKWDEDGNWELTPFGGTGTGASMPDPDNPSHFIHFLDSEGNPTTTILDGQGQPVSMDPTGTGTWVAGLIPLEYYPEGNLFLLGIPASL